MPDRPLYTPCACEECATEPAHALLHLEDVPSGALWPVRVPWEHRHDPVGWGSRARARFVDDEGEEQDGIELGRGLTGSTLLDTRGRVHKRPHGAFLFAHPGSPVLGALNKAEAKAGERWITVHPNGNESKGVPILIREEKDGTHRVIGGAGGKLTHLRLKNVKSPEEHAEEAKVREIAKSAAEKERKANQSPEEQEQEKAAKGAVKLQKQQAERKFIEKVRAVAGGVSPDLDKSKIDHLSEGAKSLLISQHHRKQLREAMKIKDKAAEELVRYGQEEATASELIKAAVEEDPHVTSEAREAAEMELALRAEEEQERAAERAGRASRGATRTDVGEAATKQQAATISALPDPSAELQELGGRSEGAALPVTGSASDEMHRRSLESVDDAKRLILASQQEETEDPTTKRIVDRALRKAGIDPEHADPETRKAVLEKEAARLARRAEIQKSRADRFKEMEKTADNPEGALAALAFSDLLSGIAGQASHARALGLTDTEQTPINPAEIAGLREILGSANELRAAQKAFQAMNKAAESGDYDRSRRAFTLDVGKADEKVEQDAAEGIRQAMTRSLLGIADPRRAAHVQSLSNGHYGALADVGLGIGGHSYLDRSVLDAVGVKGAAVLLRHALTADGHDPETVLKAVESQHVANVTSKAAKAIEAANKAVPALTTTIEDVGSIEEASKHLDAIESDLDEAQRAAGSALGSLEATATLGQVLRDKPQNEITIGGKGSGANLDTSLSWLHAAGLKPGDYKIDHKEGKITIPSSSFGRLIHRSTLEEQKQRAAVSAIKRGEADAQGWLPPGIVSRQASSFTAPVPDAPRYWKPLNLKAGDIRAELADHIGSRLAEGEPAHEILPDLLAPANVDGAKDRDAYLSAVRDLFPLRDEEGKMTKYEEHAAHFDALARDHLVKRHGSEVGAFHAQDIRPDDPKTREAIFRTLADDPATALAFKPSGTLTPQDQGALRDAFYKRMGIDPKVKTQEDRFQASLTSIGKEPSKEGTGFLFGGRPGEPGPEWRDWNRKREAIFKEYPRESYNQARALLGDEPTDPVKREEWRQKTKALQDGVAEAPTAWSKYVEAHGSLPLAVAAMQDELRGRFASRFREHHGKLTGRGLRASTAPITNAERHVAAVDPEAAEKMKAEAQASYAKLADRMGGKFSASGEGSLRDRFTRTLEESTIAQQNQGGLFAKAAPPPGGMGLFGAMAPTIPARPEPKPKPGERVSLGARAEEQIGSLIGHVGAQFDPKGGPLGLFPGLNMDGQRVHQQRAIRTLDQNGGRLGGWLGTGSGKSLISIGSFTDQHDKGKTQHGLYLVPSAVQDQFGGEMLRYTEPGKYRWETGTDKSHEERVAMLKNPDLHMRVMTHQSFRETALKLLADEAGISPDDARRRIGKEDTRGMAEWWQRAREKNGIPKHFTYIDEAQLVTEREGQEASLLNRITRAVSHPLNATHLLLGSATPHKNDESEVWSHAAMLQPERYGDKATFMANHGADLDKNPDAIRREMDPYTYSARIDPEGVDRTDSDNPRIEDGRKVGHGGPIELTGEHKAAVDKIGTAYDKARKARAKGGVDVEAIQALSPDRFEGAPKEDHERIARDLQSSLGILRESAMRRAVNQTAPEHNQKIKAMTEAIQHDLASEWTDRKGKKQKGRPSIVFTDSKKEAEMITEHLKKQGIRAATYHGGLNSAEREKVRRGFQPEAGGKALHDVIVSTSAAEAGVNLQRAKVIHHYDVPQTAKSHAQRSGRAYRQGQEGNVDVHNWYTNAEYEQNALRRLDRKAGLASVFESPIENLDETGIAGAYNRALVERHQAADPIEARGWANDRAMRGGRPAAGAA